MNHISSVLTIENEIMTGAIFSGRSHAIRLEVKRVCVNEGRDS